MAGVPSIMRVMLEAATQHLRMGARMNSVSLVLQQPEGDIAELFASHQVAYPDVAMGSYPAFVDGRYRTELVLRARDPDRLKRAMAELKAKLTTAGLL
jgi:molybdopterin-biosynthesis enzyme MoeA-like protein